MRHDSTVRNRSACLVAHAVGDDIANSDVWLSCGYWEMAVRRGDGGMWLVLAWRSRGGELRAMRDCFFSDPDVYLGFEGWLPDVRAAWLTLICTVVSATES